MSVRDEIERIIKENHIERSRCFECSKIMYSSIIKKIEQAFVLHGGDIHWSNMGHGFNPKLQCKTRDISKDRMWITRLPQILPEREKFVYKKFKWLVSECHEDVVSFVGDSLDLSCFDEP